MLRYRRWSKDSYPEPTRQDLGRWSTAAPRRDYEADGIWKLRLFPLPFSVYPIHYIPRAISTHTYLEIILPMPVEVIGRWRKPWDNPVLRMSSTDPSMTLPNPAGIFQEKKRIEYQNRNWSKNLQYKPQALRRINHIWTTSHAFPRRWRQSQGRGVFNYCICMFESIELIDTNNLMVFVLLLALEVLYRMTKVGVRRAAK